MTFLSKCLKKLKDTPEVKPIKVPKDDRLARDLLARTADPYMMFQKTELYRSMANEAEKGLYTLRVDKKLEPAIYQDAVDWQLWLRSHNFMVEFRRDADQIYPNENCVILWKYALGELEIKDLNDE